MKKGFLLLLTVVMISFVAGALAGSSIAGSPIADNCVVTATFNGATYSYSASLPSLPGVTQCSITTNDAVPQPRTIYGTTTITPPGGSGNWTYYFGDPGVTYNLKTTNINLNYVSNPMVINKANTTLNSNLVVNNIYDNSAYTSVPLGKTLKAKYITNDSGGVMQVSGKLIGTVNNGGTIKIGGDPSGVVVEGDFFNNEYDWPAAEGIVSFDVDGTTPCPMGKGFSLGSGYYSVLYITGNADFDPDLAIPGSEVDIHIVSDWVPLSYTEFHLVAAAGSVLSGFEKVQIFNKLGDNVTDNPLYKDKIGIILDDHVNLPEPSTVLLLGCGLIGLTGIMRKKLRK